MAGSSGDAQTFDIRDLPTRSVTIFPHNAQVVRVVDGIVLKAGQNRVEIVGLSPTVVEGSIKIDGHGKASISGVTVQLIRNPIHFKDVYDSDSEDGLDAPDPQRLPDKPEKLLKLEADVRKMSADIILIEDELQQLHAALQKMDSLTTMASGKENLTAEEITDRIRAYRTISQRLSEQREAAKERKVPLAEELPKLTLEMEAAKRAYMRDTQTQRKEMERAAAKWKRTHNARLRARRERFEERSKFWPLKVYKVTVELERLTDAGVLAAESLKGASDAATAEEHVSLSLYYVTGDASWTPAYDISIESKNQTGMLVYRAEISNETSEMWANTEVTLSTSQTSFTGLRDRIPELIAWSLRLMKGRPINNSEMGLVSRQERKGNTRDSGMPSKSVARAFQFGVSRGEPPPQEDSYSDEEDEEPLEGAATSKVDGKRNKFSLRSKPVHEKARSSQAPVPFGALPPPPAPAGRALLSSSPFANAEALPEPSFSFGDDASSRGQSKSEAIQIAQADWEETGMTASWDLSGLRTIAPSTNRHRHRIARFELSSLELKHVCVPKLRTDAFLTMRLQNPSDQTILPGEAGLTLDGAFLGTTSLQRIAPRETTTISLGVDESIAVEYPKPVEKRNLTSGIINKDASSANQRCVTLRHTKSAEGGTAQPVEITVRDQIPVSLDERLRIEVIKPRGLRAVGDAVRAGEAVKNENASSPPAASGRGSVSGAATGREEAWGRAVASLEKEGKIEWKVKLNPGQKVALPLEYELKFPAGEMVTYG